MKTCLMVLMLCAAGAGYVSAQNEAPIENMQPVDDAVSLRNPFKSQLPVEEIKETIVEHAPQKPDNITHPPDVQIAAPVNPIQPLDNDRTHLDHEVHETMSFKVKGIIWGVDHPYAVVDDTVVGINDKIRGATVVSIGKNGVEFNYKGETIHAHVDE